MEETISGVLEHVIYRNEDNGYTVMNLNASGDVITCVGNIGDAREGLSLSLTGTYTEHAAYGRQFRFQSFSYAEPDSAAAVEAYLGSGAIRGIGKKLAARIVKNFGKEALRILDEEPERLAEVKGVSLRKAREIGEYAREQAGMRKALVFLGGCGLSLALSLKVYREYGEDVYNILKTNPYRLAEEIDGVGFLTADRIAVGRGIAYDSEFRIRSGILYVLGCAVEEGHVYLPKGMLSERAEFLLGVSEEQIEDALTGLVMDGRTVLRKSGEEEQVYLESCYRTELATARMLLDLNVPTGESEESVRELLGDPRESGGIILEEEQKEAVTLAVTGGVTILTGGPGTGKTTTINAMIRFFRRRGKSVVLAAPTGRAARRIEETTGYEASTIHRLLEIGAKDDGDSGEYAYFGRDESNPLESDVVIIDEMSMVDIFLMHALVSAIAPGTRLILIGDMDQLPSVGAGNVLRDILGTGIFPSVRLTRIFRQAGSSDIVMNAHRINRGEAPKLDNQSRDFFFLSRTDAKQVIRDIVSLVRDRLPRYVGAGTLDIQVLAPMKKGFLGVENLNRILQRYLNPPSSEKTEREYGDIIFRTGDKVMQVRNNYQLPWEIRGKNGIVSDTGEGIFNGDLGRILSIDEAVRSMEVEFDGGRIVDYPMSELDDLEHAYAVTIHKSQGSEYPAVVMPLIGGPPLLMTRNLLYTAVTRAKNCVVILGSSRTVEAMAANESEQKRFTSLLARLLELNGTETRPENAECGREYGSIRV